MKEIFTCFTAENKHHQNQSEAGHCIKCDCSLPLNTKSPLCKDCWGKSIMKTDKFPYCHSCGCSNSSSMETPICYSCYKKGVKY